MGLAGVRTPPTGRGRLVLTGVRRGAIGVRTDRDASLSSLPIVHLLQIDGDDGEQANDCWNAEYKNRLKYLTHASFLW